ncbi:hypothetical protein AM587_10005468 [Phytophthora nicotianae]|uniref:RxLR effector protein n=1 Tax=Phytophthora nicotianae TaxID=4792 RepID=A0A0W8C0G3_PHYNI|nr:hypothetical protein AM587_10004906 [Phytophthora nicotianae]KUF86253.1 hypothetical protein AM587_10005468 [Phytophthora nicotianae]
MRRCFIVLVTVISFLAIDTISATRSTDAAELKAKAAQALRAERKQSETLKSGEEERGIVTKLAVGLKEKQRKNFVRFQSIFIYTDDIGQKIPQKGITPDEVYKYLKLHKPKKKTVEQVEET